MKVNGKQLRQGKDFTIEGDTITFAEGGIVPPEFYNRPNEHPMCGCVIPAGIYEKTNGEWEKMHPPIPPMLTFDNWGELDKAIQKAINGDTIIFYDNSIRLIRRNYEMTHSHSGLRESQSQGYNPETDLIKDDMLFKPYKTMGGYQCIIPTKKGNISVRYGGYSTLTSKDKPYEVWYPDEDAPTPDQTADDIFEYIKNSGE